MALDAARPGVTGDVRNGDPERKSAWDGYMRKGDVVLIPIRMGAGLRLGINAGYMKFSKKQRWLPF